MGGWAGKHDCLAWEVEVGEGEGEEEGAGLTWEGSHGVGETWGGVEEEEVGVVEGLIWEEVGAAVAMEVGLTLEVED